MQWCALACSGVLWRALECTGMYWRAQAYSGVHWRALGVLWRALACAGVLWRALLYRTQVLDNKTPLPDKKTQITWIILKNSTAVMCVFLKLFVHEFLYKFFDSIDLNGVLDIDLHIL
jgi:hypothetical protein